jgi:hypothetical protein
VRLHVQEDILQDVDIVDVDVDILVATVIDDNEDDDVVVLSFDHILSRVEFRMLHSLSEGLSTN